MNFKKKGAMKKKIIIIVIVGLFLLIQPIRAQTWNATKRLTYNSGYSQAPVSNVTSNNHIHVVWTDDTPGNGEVYHKWSINGGSTWTTKRLTYNSGYTYKADIAIGSSNHLHVVWDDNSSGNWEIYHKKSTNGGTTWTTKRLTYNTGISNYPVIAVDSNNHIHVAWDDNSPGSDEIFHKRSTDGGATWTTKRLTYNSGNSNSPDIAVDSNNHIHVVWYDWTPGITEIYYKKSTNGGTTWTSKRLTYNSGNSDNPNIAIDSNDHIHVVWYDNTPGTQEIFHKKSTDGGATWTTKRLTYNSGRSLFPAIASDSFDSIHVVWYDETPGNGEIYYKRSTNGGSNWTTKRLTYNSGNSAIPTITVGSNGHIHVVWRDYTPGNQEIYYKKGIQ
jgi:hypothetical protein